MVAQIDEQQPAMVANAMTPARQPSRLADMALAERAAGVGPVTMHGYSKNRCRRIESGARGCPAKKGQGLPEAFRRGNRMRRQAGTLGKWRQSPKSDGKTRVLRIGAPQPDCLIPAH